MTTNTIIATTPNGMVEAQGKLLGWIDTKLAACESERSETEALLVQLRNAKAATTHADRVLDSCRRRERFYEKVRAALQAGYYIIPPFDCQVFAIRTDRSIPPEQLSTSATAWKEPPVPKLPAGQGGYVNPIPARSLSHTEERERADKTMVTDKYFSNDAWREVEFPVKAMKPQLIEAASRAMESLIFDALAIAPPYRAADPIIVGQIKHWKPNRQPLTFFVAWWLNESDLD